MSSIYTSKDGVDFTSEEAMQIHEAFIDKFIFIEVTHDPDLSEGRRYYKRHLAMVMVKHPNFAELLVTEYCRKQYGKDYSFVMGAEFESAMMENFVLRKISANEARQLATREFRNDSRPKMDNCISIEIGNASEMALHKDCDTVNYYEESGFVVCSFKKAII